MRKMEKSPLKGSILANDCGTGKTFTFTTLQYIHYLELESTSNHTKKAKRAKSSQQSSLDQHKVVARPTLLLCPAALVAQHADEILARFGRLLNVFIYYGTKATANESRVAITLDPTEWETHMADRAAQTDDPKVREFSGRSARFLDGVLHG